MSSAVDMVSCCYGQLLICSAVDIGQMSKLSAVDEISCCYGQLLIWSAVDMVSC